MNEKLLNKVIPNKAVLPSADKLTLRPLTNGLPQIHPHNNQSKPTPARPFFI